MTLCKRIFAVMKEPKQREQTLQIFLSMMTKVWSFSMTLDILLETK